MFNDFVRSKRDFDAHAHAHLNTDHEMVKLPFASNESRLMIVS